ncbi:MAG: hypothetical protein Q4G13_02345, partial [Moraxella sp.]|nr:hypothetical protein [Moraxella sp.]
QNPEVQNTAAQNTAETVAVSPSSTTAKTDNNAAQSTPPAPTSEPMSKEEFLKEAEQRIYRERSTAPSK